MGAISVVIFVALMAIYILKDVTVVIPEDEETIANIYYQGYDQVLFEEIVKDRITKEDTVNRCKDSCM